MAKQKKNEIAKISGFQAPVVGADVQVNQDHFIAISVGAVESRLFEARKDLETTIKALKKELKSGSEAIDKGIKGLVTAEVAKVEKIIAPAFKALGLEAEVSGDTNNGPNFEKGTVKICYQFGKNSEHRYHGSTISNSITVKLPSEVKKLRKKFEANSEKHNELMSELHEVARQLTELPRMERQAKAKLAEAVLEQTAEGRKLLKDLKAKISLG
jgi:DNA repair exonuclease SbcCD ATPase subunit